MTRFAPTSASPPRPPDSRTTADQKTLEVLQATAPVGLGLVDRCLRWVRDLVSSSGSRHVIGAITGLAKGFGLQTIAEGVEDGETLTLLGDSGVDFAQGYHLGRPAPLAEAA